MTVIINGIDREHQHIHVRVVRDAPDDNRCMGGKSDAAHDPLFSSSQDVIVNAVFPVCFPIGKFVRAMDGTVV